MPRFAARSRQFASLVLVATLAVCEADDEEGAKVLDGDRFSQRTPKFVPATLTKSIYKVCAQNTEPLRFGVDDVRVGLTQVHLDDDNLGPLYRGSLLGALDEEALTIAQPGAMRKSGHVLQLVTPSVDGPVRSKKLNVSVKGCAVPRLVAEHSPNALVAGHAVVQWGAPDRAVLAVLDLGDVTTPRVTLMRARGHGWHIDEPTIVGVPGYVARVGERRPAIAVDWQRAAQLDPMTDLGSDPAEPPSGELEHGRPDRLRVAWRVGPAGDAIDVREVVFADGGPVTGDPQRAIDVADVTSPFAQWTSLMHPAFVGDVLLAELREHVDVESPFPGDRRVLAARWFLGRAQPEPAFSVVTQARVDLDLIAPAIDARALELGRPAPLSVRVGGRAGMVRRDHLTGEVRVLALHDDEPGFLAEVYEDSSDDVANDVINVITVVGGISSRTTAGVWSDGSVRVRLVDTGGRNLSRLRTVDVGLLPAGMPTGPMVGTQLRGTAVFLVPYGSASPVFSFALTGDQIVPAKLGGLYCDAVEVRQLAVGENPDTVGLACVLDGEVFLGLLHAQDPPSDDDRRR